MIKLSLQYSQSVSPIYWQDILWACDSSIMDWTEAKKYALSIVSDSSSSLESDLAMLNSLYAEDIKHLVEKIVSENFHENLDSKGKWLFISLKYVYDHRSVYDNPLQVVEDIYADFDYPEEIESFVRYMPPMDGYDPTAHSFEANIQRLMQKWKDFLDTSAHQLK